MNIRQIQEAREFYGIDDWSSGYFAINDQGNVVCYPTANDHLSVDLSEIMDKCHELEVKTPVIVRFPQIIESQLQRMHTSFRQAIADYKYEGKHRGVFPFKVNQRHEFIENVVHWGRKMDYGLEVGSKAEFLAALSYQLSPDALLICNGFKDIEFINLAFIAASVGKNVVLVIEGIEELQLIIKQKQDFDCCPQIGIRFRLYSRGSGKWEKSSGEASKFGLTTIEVLQCLDLLEQEDMKDKLAMLHFHIGSQVTEIKRIKNAIKEAARVYSKIVKMGFNPSFLNIGGGVGVDYDGSKTSFASSANYSLQEFANDTVYVIGDVCKNEHVKCPDIVCESGRIIAAYHSVIVTDVRKVQGVETEDTLSDIGIRVDEKSHKFLIDLKDILDNINKKNYIEFYHDAVEYFEELFTLFSLGYVQLKDRAMGEEIFHRICHRALYYASYEQHPPEEFEDLQKLMVSKYLANFSIFQSIPDAWAIDQIFPVMPIAYHTEKPTQKSTIVDITCDSDGCLSRFVDRRDVKPVLDLHTPPADRPYYIGFFLVGAYQESLASEHNLFGATNEIEIMIDQEGKWDIVKITKGDPIEELLEARNYDIKQMIASFKTQLSEAEQTGKIRENASVKLLKRLKDYMKAMPYLVSNFD